MKLREQKHLKAYGVLIFGLILTAFLFMSFWPHRFYQRIVIVACMLFYVVWGSVTHFKTNHFTKEVLYEYLGIALLGGLLLLLITL